MFNLQWSIPNCTLSCTWQRNMHLLKISFSRITPANLNGSLSIEQQTSTKHAHQCTWPRPDLRSRWGSFWSSESCTFLGLYPPPFSRGAQNWRLAMIVWDVQGLQLFGARFLAVTVSWRSRDFEVREMLISSEATGFLSPRCLRLKSLWLWLQVGRNKPCTLAAMTVSPLPGLSG